MAAVGVERGAGEEPVSFGGGPPQIKTSGHRSAPLGHTTVPASTRTARKSAGSLLIGSKTGPSSKAEMSRSITDPSVSVKRDRKSTRLNSSHSQISYAVFCLKKKKKKKKK